ncbi:hypothetical protein ROZALSC1DRAFT_20250 [Rozella allomycis CSF55]|uniref:Uncharacterized protein n=1 Tax=Rozella allomycis (strain CSF55) TaxID=988480 RepID=A0A4P9YRN5_ROZAC|nr:hypothetical protein ROZALSC1DRAFT_20250 [Rozella allomycis CSF55]
MNTLMPREQFNLIPKHFATKFRTLANIEDDVLVFPSLNNENPSMNDHLQYIKTIKEQIANIKTRAKNILKLNHQIDHNSFLVKDYTDNKELLSLVSGIPHSQKDKALSCQTSRHFTSMRLRKLLKMKRIL